MAKIEAIIIDGLCYLAHPADSCGVKEDNIRDALQIQKRLTEKHELSIVNPLAIMSAGPSFDWDKCMEQCKRLLRTCDGLILGPKWYLSRGCKQEVDWAMQWDMPIFIYAVETDDLTQVDYETLTQMLNIKEIYNDHNINVKHDDNLLYINYFGNQYIFSKSKKHITVPEAEDAFNAAINPEDYLEEVGQGLSLYTQLPKEYHYLLTDGMDYAFFFGRSAQLCLKSDSMNEQLYMNKYNAFILLQILLSSGDLNADRLTCYRRIGFAENKEVIIYGYYVAPSGILDYRDLRCKASNTQITVYYNLKEHKITVSKDGKNFVFTNLETSYLLRLLKQNLPSSMNIASIG